MIFMIKRIGKGNGGKKVEVRRKKVEVKGGGRNNEEVRT